RLHRPLPQRGDARGGRVLRQAADRHRRPGGDPARPDARDRQLDGGRGRDVEAGGRDRDHADRPDRGAGGDRAHHRRAPRPAHRRRLDRLAPEREGLHRARPRRRGRPPLRHEVVRYGLSLPDGGECGDPRFLLELGELAEAAGWEGLFLEEYVCYQGDPAAPTSPAWTVLAALAVRTSRLLLGTAVTPLARRRPWDVAREVATVDLLSGGRALLGVGLGDTGGSIGEDA